MLLYRYSRWDGSQEIFPLREDDLMEQLSEQLLGQADVSSALRSLTQRGLRGRHGQRVAGVQEMQQRLRQRRQQLLERYNLDSVLDRVQQELEEIKRLERDGIEKRSQELQEKLDAMAGQGGQDSWEAGLLRRMQQMAQKNRQFLESLPRDPGGSIRKLQQYEFMDSQAKTKFDELLNSLQEQVVKAHLTELSRELQRLTPEDLQSVKEMLRDLNHLLEQRLQGEQPNFKQFMEKHGQHFGPNRPSSLDQLLEQMQNQMAQLESLINSLSPQQRQQLEEVLDSVFKDEELLGELARLGRNMETLRPRGSLRKEYPFQGNESLTLEQAMGLMEQLQGMDELERQLKRAQHAPDLSEVDSRLVREVLGDEALQEVEQLRHLTDVLEEAGYVRKVGNRFELTPRGMRKIGQKALQEIFMYIKRDRTGNHTARYRGPGGERSEGSKQYEFGDPFDPDLNQTVLNALFREAPGVPVHLKPEDFEIYKTEQLALSSTVLMIDLSLSMAMRGNFLAAKKVGLALDNLIRTQFPRDNLYIVGFSTYAREVKPDRLPYLTWDEFDPYTNIQHGLVVSQKLLARTPAGTKQIIMISDGEPTAHLEGGQLFLQYPPSPRTIRETLKEVRRCTSRGITINTFMLDRNSYLVEFVDQMTRINRGRVFYTSPDRLGQYILVDYLSSRRRVLS